MPPKTAATPKATSKSELRRQAADRRLALKPLKDEMDACEREVARLHAELERLDCALAAPGLFTDKPERGAELAKARADAARQLDQAESRWISVAEKYEAAMEEP
jgi:ATP-binding cassette subfamily F protein 3